jgi:hypothetical protein
MSKHKSHLEIAREQWAQEHTWEAMNFILNHLELHLESAEVQPHRHMLHFARAGEQAISTHGPIPEPREETPEPRWDEAYYPLSPREEIPQSEKPSSVATETAAETKPTWSGSFTSSYHANPDGTLTLFPPASIWASLSSRNHLGLGLEVAIGAHLISKGSTPPDGSASPSTEAQARAASGVVGNGFFPESQQAGQ